MKKALLYAAGLVLFVFCSELVSIAQTAPAAPVPGDDKDKPKTITLKAGEPQLRTYDAGTMRMLAASADTNGTWSLVELTEMPGYHTNLHRHNHTGEAFYVLEGVLTLKMNRKVTEYPAGSYVLIPRGTPHAQGNAGKVPVRVLLTMTPGGFERSFVDRAELYKRMKPTDPDFRKRRKENADKGNYDVEFLADWASL